MTYFVTAGLVGLCVKADYLVRVLNWSCDDTNSGAALGGHMTDGTTQFLPSARCGRLASYSAN